jgi:hypothetical protein
MGQIDSDKMYTNIMNWEWGNSGSDEIYHDPETRRESITYRTNLARLMDKLIEEGKIKSKKLSTGHDKNASRQVAITLGGAICKGYQVGEKAKAQDL